MANTEKINTKEKKEKPNQKKTGKKGKKGKSDNTNLTQSSSRDTLNVTTVPVFNFNFAIEDFSESTIIDNYSLLDICDKFVDSYIDFITTDNGKVTNSTDIKSSVFPTIVEYTNDAAFKQSLISNWLTNNNLSITNRTIPAGTARLCDSSFYTITTNSSNPGLLNTLNKKVFISIDAVKNYCNKAAAAYIDLFLGKEKISTEDIRNLFYILAFNLSLIRRVVFRYPSANNGNITEVRAWGAINPAYLYKYIADANASTDESRAVNGILNLLETQFPENSSASSENSQLNKLYIKNIFIPFIQNSSICNSSNSYFNDYDEFSDAPLYRNKISNQIEVFKYILKNHADILNTIRSLSNNFKNALGDTGENISHYNDILKFVGIDKNPTESSDIARKNSNGYANHYNNSDSIYEAVGADVLVADNIINIKQISKIGTLIGNALRTATVNPYSGLTYVVSMPLKIEVTKITNPPIISSDIICSSHIFCHYRNNTSPILHNGAGNKGAGAWDGGWFMSWYKRAHPGEETNYTLRHEATKDPSWWKYFLSKTKGDIKEIQSHIRASVDYAQWCGRHMPNPYVVKVEIPMSMLLKYASTADNQLAKNRNFYKASISFGIEMCAAANSEHNLTPGSVLSYLKPHGYLPANIADGFTNCTALIKWKEGSTVKHSSNIVIAGGNTSGAKVDPTSKGSGTFNIEITNIQNNKVTIYLMFRATAGGVAGYSYRNFAGETFRYQKYNTKSVSYLNTPTADNDNWSKWLDESPTNSGFSHWGYQVKLNKFTIEAF